VQAERWQGSQASSSKELAERSWQHWIGRQLGLGTALEEESEEAHLWGVGKSTLRQMRGGSKRQRLATGTELESLASDLRPASGVGLPSQQRSYWTSSSRRNQKHHSWSTDWLGKML
jgi:hypothetical protein